MEKINKKDDVLDMKEDEEEEIEIIDKEFEEKERKGW